MSQIKWSTYFYQNGDSTRVKIGKTTNLATRLKDLRTGSVTGSYIAIFEGNRETEFHKRFEKFRDVRRDGRWMGGKEWYFFSQEIQTFLATEPRTRTIPDVLSIYDAHVNATPLFRREAGVTAYQEFYDECSDLPALNELDAISSPAELRARAKHYLVVLFAQMSMYEKLKEHAHRVLQHSELLLEDWDQDARSA